MPEQVNRVFLPSPSNSNDEEILESQNRRSISQYTQTPRITQTTRTENEPEGQMNGDHTPTTTRPEEEEQWHLIPITFQPHLTPRLPSISRFPNLSTVITQIGPQILIEEEIAIPREDSPTLGTQDSFRTLIGSTSTIETENEIPPAIPARSLRRPRRRSPSSDSESPTSEVAGWRRENRVEYIGAQGLDRVNGLNGIPRPPPRLVSRWRRRDATIGVENEYVNRFPAPPSGRVSRLRGRNTPDELDDDFALMRGHLTTSTAMEARVEGEEANGTSSSLRPRVSILRPVGNSLMLDVGEDEEVLDGFEDEIEDEETELSIPSPAEEREDQDLQEEEQDYNFTPQRRRRVMQKMTRDIYQYTTRREEEFGREHGYQLYPLYTDLPPIQAPSPTPNSPEQEEAITSPPRLRRIRFRIRLDPNQFPSVAEEDPEDPQD